jgi:hypothetical protein
MGSLQKARRDGTTRKTLTCWLKNVKIDIGEIVWGDMDWIHLSQDMDQWRAVMNMVNNTWVP